MSAASLNVVEMTDILFQKPGRVSEGLLEGRTSAARLADVFRFGSTGQAPENGLQKFRAGKQVTFYDSNYGASRVSEEHPRSFRRALMELRHYGFSARQVNAINTEAIYGFWMFSFDHVQQMNLPLAAGLRARYGRRLAEHWASKAFLGVSFTSYDDFGKVPLANDAFGPDLEGLAYGHLQTHFDYKYRKSAAMFTPGTN